MPKEPIAPLPPSIAFHAGPQDSEELFLFLYNMRDEVANGGADAELLAEAVRDLVNCASGTAFICRSGAGRIEASIGLFVERIPLVRACRLRTLWFVVAPYARQNSEGRNTGHARGLILAAQRFADDLQRPLVIEEHVIAKQSVDRDSREYRWGFSTTVAHNRRVRLFGRFFQPAGVMFSHNPQEDAAA